MEKTFEVLDEINKSYKPSAAQFGGKKVDHFFNLFVAVTMIVVGVLMLLAGGGFFFEGLRTSSAYLCFLKFLSSISFFLGLFIMLVAMLFCVISAFSFFKLGSSDFEVRAKEKLDASSCIFLFSASDLKAARVLCLQEISMRDGFFKKVFNIFVWLTTILSIFATVYLTIGNEVFLGLEKDSIGLFLARIFVPLFLLFLMLSAIFWCVWSRSKARYNSLVEVIDLALSRKH